MKLISKQTVIGNIKIIMILYNHFKFLKEYWKFFQYTIQKKYAEENIKTGNNDVVFLREIDIQVRSSVSCIFEFSYW